MKTCNICDQVLAYSQFPKKPDHRDGHASRCKKCHSRVTMQCLAKRRAKSTAKPATTDQARSAPYNAAQGRELNRHYRIPDLSHLEEIPAWRT